MVGHRTKPPPVNKGLPMWATWVVFLGSSMGALWALYQLRDKFDADIVRLVIGSPVVRVELDTRTKKLISDSLFIHVRDYHRRPR